MLVQNQYTSMLYFRFDPMPYPEHSRHPLPHPLFPSSQKKLRTNLVRNSFPDSIPFFWLLLLSYKSIIIRSNKRENFLDELHRKQVQNILSVRN